MGREEGSGWVERGETEEGERGAVVEGCYVSFFFFNYFLFERMHVLVRPFNGQSALRQGHHSKLTAAFWQC